MKQADKNVAEAWLVELQRERDELAERLTRIAASKWPADVTNTERVLIENQLTAMQSYLRFLEKRLAIHTKVDVEAVSRADVLQAEAEAKDALRYAGGEERLVKAETQATEEKLAAVGDAADDEDEATEKED
jgi:hypothetical protein